MCLTQVRIKDFPGQRLFFDCESRQLPKLMDPKPVLFPIPQLLGCLSWCHLPFLTHVTSPQAPFSTAGPEPGPLSSLSQVQICRLPPLPQSRFSPPDHIRTGAATPSLFPNCFPRLPHPSHALGTQSSKNTSTNSLRLRPQKVVLDVPPLSVVWTW